MAQSTKPRKHRSPAYPFVNLETAITRARELYGKERSHPTRIGTVAGHWGFGVKSSGGMQTIAALKQYGLLEGSGGNHADRKVKLTDLARRILLLPEDSPDRSQLLREAALRPSLFSEMFSKWHSELPSDENIRSYLLLDRNFNDGTVSSVIRNFRDTLGYSGAMDSDTMSDAGDDSDWSSRDESEESMETAASAERRAPASSPAAAMVFSWPLARGVMAEVRLSGGEIKPEHLERLRQYLDLAKVAVATDDETPES